MKPRSIIISISLAVIILLNIFYVPLTYAYYYMDQSGFIALLCENKDEPELECNGKCHLKKVSQNDSENNNNPIPLVLEKEIILFFQNPTCKTETKSYDDRSIFDNYLMHYFYTRTYNFFHPPRV